MSLNISDFLTAQLNRIRAKNPRFSVRSLASKVDIPPGRVSELLNGKRALTEYYAEKITQGLALNEGERDELYTYVSAPSRKTISHRELLDSEIALITSWEHYAILNLLNVSDFESDPKWIAARLGLSLSQVKTSLELLENLNLIEKHAGTLRRTHKRLTTSVDIPSAALRESLRQDIKKSLDVLEQVPPELRDYSSITMAINMKKLKKAKKLIGNFQDRMSLLLEEGPRTEIYNLSVQLFPMTVLQEDEK